MEDELRENVKNFLLNHDLCRMCILRALGERQTNAYCRQFEEWRTPGEPQCKRVQRGICPACLGLLEPVYLFEVFEAVVEAVAISECRFHNFLLTIAIPPVCLLRQRLVYLTVKNKFEMYKLAEECLVTVKDCVKMVIGFLFEDEFKVLFSPKASFQVNIILPGALTPVEQDAVNKLAKPVVKKSRKAMRRDEFSTKTITSFLQRTSEDNFRTEFKFPPPEALCKAPEPPKVTCGHLQIYLAGRYCKYSRELSQTPWLIEGERKMKNSVEELITDVVRRTVLCERITFSSSGREDVDVRMLGEGRPFILEVWRPKRIDWLAEEMAQIEVQINTSTKDIAVNRLQLIGREQVKDLKDGEEHKRKFYCAYCVTAKPTSEIDFSKLTSLKNLVLKQNTPMRVLHRRTAMIRDRTIHSAEIEIVDSFKFKLILCTQAGTYVKEFVHGDLGRTLPNVCTLLDEAVDIENLDVTKVDLDWPPERGATELLENGVLTYDSDRSAKGDIV